MCSELVATLGLVLDIFGVILVWRFDLGKRLPVTDSKGEKHYITLGTDKQRKTGPFLSHMGIALIVGGFIVQIWALWI